MTSTMTLLADAATTVINTAAAAGLLGSLPFVARRSYPDWDDDFKDLKSLEVDVVFVTSAGDVVELDSFESVSSEPSIDISVRKRFEPIDRDETGRLKNESIDPLVKLIESIHELFAGHRESPLNLAAGIDANWISATVRTHCDYRRLREGFYLGVVRVHWNVSKAVS